VVCEFFSSPPCEPKFDISEKLIDKPLPKIKEREKHELMNAKVKYSKQSIPTIVGWLSW
jgi:hypothetical protein